MIQSRIRLVALFGAGLLFSLLVWQCTRESASTGTYAGLLPSTDYVGMNQCQGCHAGVHDSYKHTGMGKSFHLASPEKSDGIFDEHALVYDTAADLYYRPHFRNDSMFITEFRVLQGDTVHYLEQYISYIIGSGQHTNSHLLDRNGYVYQAPVTFYTQEGKWDLAPGFEGGYNSRFSRLIELECLSCHNGYPELVEHSVNKFSQMPTGIDCERCHGPGEVHVREKLAGIIVDTANEIDYSIVNPGDLSKEAVMSLCQRCHLQGVAVLQPGQSFYDFRPGMELSEVMEVYLPRFEGEESRFIMASQADRLRMSKCYQATDMSCITCHHPHKSVEMTGRATFNAQCRGCHEQQLCTVEPGGDCVGCHMPPSSAIDIPHVSITDHFIRKDYSGGMQHMEEGTAQTAAGDRMRLKCLTSEEPTDSSHTAAYLHFFEKYQHQAYLLEKAGEMALQLPPEQSFDLKVHFHYLSGNWSEIAVLGASSALETVESSWTAYRIGEAFNEIGDYRSAIPWLERAAGLKKLDLDMQYKLAAAYFKTRQWDKARPVFEFILSENPDYQRAHFQLGHGLFLIREFETAEKHLIRAVELDPDHRDSFVLLANFYQERGNQPKSDRYRALAARLN